MKREQKIKIWRAIALFGLLACLLFGIRVTSRAQNAVSILDKAAGAYENSNGISASFTLNTRSDVQKVSESFEGTIHMKGDKFTLVTPCPLVPVRQDKVFSVRDRALPHSYSSW